MAKKQAKAQGSSEPKLKTTLRKYILKESDISGEPSIPNMDFTFEIQSIKGNAKSPKMRIFKLKGKDFVEFGCKIAISPQHLKMLEADPEKRNKLLGEIARICLFKNVHYILNQKEFFVIFDRMYLDNNRIPTMNRYYGTFKNLLNTIIYTLSLFGKLGKNDGKHDDSIIGDSSLYT